MYVYTDKFLFWLYESKERAVHCYNFHEETENVNSI